MQTYGLYGWTERFSTKSLFLLTCSPEPPRVTKDVVCFHAGDFPHVVQRLQLDLYEPPLSQVLHYTHTQVMATSQFRHKITSVCHLIVVNYC